jgi:hypothetical protein
MKKIVTLIVTLSFQLTIAQVSIEWSNFTRGVAMSLDATENVYTADWDYNPAGDISITKRNSSGVMLWEIVHNNTDVTRHEVATWIETDSQGNVIVSGTTRSGYSNPVDANSILMKFSPSGNLLWRVVYESDFDGSSTRKCLIDLNDNIYVLGLGMGTNGLVAKVKKFSPTGATIWNYYDAGFGRPLNFKFTPDNNILIIYKTQTGIINSFSKISLTGNFLWNSGAITSSSAGDAAGDIFGNTYIINGNNNSGSTLKKLNSTGTVVWEQENSIIGTRVEVGNDNNPIIAGYPSGSFGTSFIKYNNDGNVIWQNLDADGPNFSLLAHAQMKIDNQNAVYLAGGTMSQMAICKVNGDGTSAWTIATSSGYPVDFDFGVNNSVYVTGGTTAKINQVNLSTSNVDNLNNPIRIAPNPCGNLLEFDGIDDYISYKIIDFSGRIVFENSLKNNQIDVSSLSSGLYQLVIFTDTNIKYQAKFTKK